jgi:hypothetical protein
VPNIRRSKAALAVASELLERYERAILAAAFRPLDAATPQSPRERSAHCGHSWERALLGEVVSIIDYRGRTPPFSSEGIPHLRSHNIKASRIVWENLAFVSEETYGQYMTRVLPRPGDLLFTTEAPMGQLALAPTDVPFSLAQRMVLLRPCEELDSSFLMHQLMSAPFQTALGQTATGTTVSGIATRHLRKLELLVPPRNVQIACVRQIERLLAGQARILHAVEVARSQLDRLERATLSKAFRGELVPQSPDDEPASTLLDRLRAERSRRTAMSPFAHPGRLAHTASRNVSQRSGVDGRECERHHLGRHQRRHS